MPISDWLPLMPDTVTLEAVATRDEYGAPVTYAAAASYRARVRNKSSRVLSRASGEEVIASGVVVLNGVVSGISPEDRLTLADGSTPKIISWTTASDDQGVHHTKIYFG